MRISDWSSDVCSSDLAGGAEAVAAGQVDQRQRPTIGEAGMASLAFDGDARIVGDLLPRAGQRVEQARFAGVGIADERDGGDRAGHAAAAAGSTSIAAAWRPRMMTCMRPMPSASGSREKRLPRWSGLDRKSTR